MRDLARVEIERARGVVVAQIGGEIDASNAAEVQRRMLEAIDNEGVGLVVDLTGTTYVDSAGIRALFDTGERLQVRGMELRVVAAPASFTADVLETVRMAERFAVDDDAPSAVAAVLERLPGNPAPG